MRVNEIFFSIQGESSFMGLPCAFIRLTGCNLRCTYCDTEYAFFEGSERSIDDILEELKTFPTKLALVTGGEPMLQPEVHDLFGRLLSLGYTVCVETGGQVLLKDLDTRIHKVVDMKCPSSGMAAHNKYENVQYLTGIDEVKFVISDRTDFQWACDAVRRFDLCSRTRTVLFSPVYGTLPYSDLAQWVLQSGLAVRLQIQLHKIIWPGISRGV